MFGMKNQTQVEQFHIKLGILARSFHHEQKIFGYRSTFFRVADGVELAVVLLLSITVLAVALTGGLTFYFDPQLEWVTLSPLGAAAAGLLCFCPTISNVGEALQWRRLKRKN
jgi:hypothetical protein